MTRNAYRIVFVSWVAFVISFFLPATNILQMAGTVPGTPLTGWEAFTVSIYAGVFNFWAWLGDLRVLVFAFFPFTNAVMFIAPACSCLGRYAFAPALILVPATLLPWLLPHNLLGDLFIGFYVWNGSYLTMSLGCCLLAVGCLIDDTNG